MNAFYANFLTEQVLESARRGCLRSFPEVDK